MSNAIICIDKKFAFKNSRISYLALIFNLNNPRTTVNIYRFFRPWLRWIAESRAAWVRFLMSAETFCHPSGILRGTARLSPSVHWHATRIPSRVLELLWTAEQDQAIARRLGRNWLCCWCWTDGWRPRLSHLSGRWSMETRSSNAVINFSCCLRISLSSVLESCLNKIFVKKASAVTSRVGYFQ